MSHYGRPDGNRSPSKFEITSAKATATEKWLLQQDITKNLMTSIEPSTKRAYTSSYQKWLYFHNFYEFPYFPSVNSLCGFIAWLGKLELGVPAILSGLAYFMVVEMKGWEEIRNNPLVIRSITSIRKNRIKPVNRAIPLELDRLDYVMQGVTSGLTNAGFDGLLFASMLSTGFFGIMRLGELVVDSKMSAKDVGRKVIRRDSVVLDSQKFEFHLPYHKGDRFFKGSTVSIKKSLLPSTFDFLAIISHYIRMRDKKFSSNSLLFLRADGTSPSRKWFIDLLKQECSSKYSGHSLRSGGATHFSSIGVKPSTIQRLGRWSGPTFEQYCRDNPSVLAVADIHLHLSKN